MNKREARSTPDPSNAYKNDPGGLYLTTNPTNLFSLNTIFNELVWTGAGTFIGYEVGGLVGSIPLFEGQTLSLAFPGAAIGALAYTALLLRNKFTSILTDYEKWFVDTFGDIEKQDPTLKAKFRQDYGIGWDESIKAYDNIFYKYDPEAKHWMDWLYVTFQRGTDLDKKGSDEGDMIYARWKAWEGSVLRLQDVKFHPPPPVLPPPLDIRTAQEKEKDNGATTSDLARLNKIIMTIWENRNRDKLSLSVSERKATPEYEWISGEMNKEYREYTLGNKDKFLKGWEANLGIK